MKISILCSDAAHPVFSKLEDWARSQQTLGHEVTLTTEKRQLPGGDVLFLVSCSELLKPDERAKYRATLVLHASDLPRGRGWSPHVWAIVGGAEAITVCLLEASEPVDSGAVWLRHEFRLDGSELLPEINEKLFAAELALMTEAAQRFGEIVPVPQSGEPGVYMKRRTPADSRLDPEQTIASQFDLLRVVDSNRYPAFMDFRGHRYVLRIEKVGPSETE